MRPSGSQSVSIAAPSAPQVRLHLGVTGHRAAHPAYGSRSAEVEATLEQIFGLIAAAVASAPPPFEQPFASVRLHSLLADGADQWASQRALERNWQVVALLPFGERLNRTINSQPQSASEARALLDEVEDPLTDPVTLQRATVLQAMAARVQVFELADADTVIERCLLAMLDAPDDASAAEVFRAESSVRVALAGRVMIEQSDLVIAVWDGARTSVVGGTGHTVAAALDMGAPVLWIDPADPSAWKILLAPEALAVLREVASIDEREDLLRRLVHGALVTGPAGTAHPETAQKTAGVSALSSEHWRAHSPLMWHAYRWVERAFDGEGVARPRRSLTQTYETPAKVAAGSGAAVMRALAALPASDSGFLDRVGTGVLQRFAWADGIAAYLSDTYRGSMVINFVLSALAVISGVAYLPLVDSAWKWPFAAFELLLLAAILGITWIGQRRRWHGRWFETRRVAEYLRHSPLLLSIGAARAPGRWPRGSDTSWPEHYARHALREAGLPRVRITTEYLRAVLKDLIAPHVASQRAYHAQKARRLAAVHHNLDRLSERSFQIAVAAAALYLVFAAGNVAGILHDEPFKSMTKLFTFFGVALPTFGGALSGIRFFGDFERFAAISRVTAGKLEGVDARIAMILRAPDSSVDYATVSELAHAADDIVVSEIGNWQAVFEAKQITVPA